MKRILAMLLLGASLGIAAGCCKDCVRCQPSSPKVEEYPVRAKPERIHGGII